MGILPLAQHCLAITEEDLTDKRTVWLEVDTGVGPVMGSVDLQLPSAVGLDYWLNDRSAGTLGSRDFIAHLADRLTVLESSIGTGGRWSVVWDDPLPGYYLLERDTPAFSARLMVPSGTVDADLIGMIETADRWAFTDASGRFVISSAKQAGRLWLPPRIPLKWTPWIIQAGTTRLRPWDGELLKNKQGEWVEWDIQYEKIPALWVRERAHLREDHRLNNPGMSPFDDNIALERSWREFYTVNGPWVFYPDRADFDEWYEVELFEAENLNRLESIVREERTSPENYTIRLRCKNYIRVV